MTIWAKGIEVHPDILAFTSNNDQEYDQLLAEYDILGNMAHAIMLEKVKILTSNELRDILSQLRAMYFRAKEGRFLMEKEVEDIHSQVEKELSANLGSTGEKIHTGRSRNDQILLDIKLFSRCKIEAVVNEVSVLIHQLVTLSNKYKDYLMPGYTHLQAAMPSSFGLWFGAFAESLTEDLQVLLGAYKLADQNPLGSAAGYGSSFPIDRQITTDLLGFETLHFNSINAQMNRGKLEKTVAFAISSVASTLSKLSMDVCLFMNENFQFLSFPDELTTGSSIMPHKKNPDVFEIIRGSCNQIQAVPFLIQQICTNLPTGYQRDYQLIKEQYLPLFPQIIKCLKMAGMMLSNIIVKEDILKDKKYKLIFSVEKINQRVKEGIPFRRAYKDVAYSIERKDFDPDKSICHIHEGSIGNLCNDQILKKMNKILKKFYFNRGRNAIEKLLLV